MFAELYLTDGTEKVNLLGANQAGHGIGLAKVRFTRPTRQQSNVFIQEYDTVEESYALKIIGLTQDNVIAYQRSLDTMLEKARNYFVSEGEFGLVWLVSRAASESNTRYAVVYGGQTQDYPDVYDQPFATTGNMPVMSDLDLALTRGVWLANPPLSPACHPITNGVNWQNYVPSWTNRTGVTNGRGLYTIKSNGNMFAGQDGIISISTNNGTSWGTSKTLSAGNVAQDFIVAFGKLYAAVARAAGANSDSGIWSATLAGGSWTQEVASANAYSFAILQDGRLLCGGSSIIRVQSASGGAWSTYSSALTGSVKALTVTSLGTLIAGDQYDVWRQPKGGTLAITNVTSVGPFGHAISFAATTNRVVLVSDADVSLSLDDGLTFKIVLAASTIAAFYSASKDLVYVSYNASGMVYISADGGITWTQESASYIPVYASPSGQITEANTGSIFGIHASNILEKSYTTLVSGPQAASCTVPTYVANRSNNPMLTYITVFDNSPTTYTALGGNVNTTTGSKLWPTTVAVGDILYLGMLVPILTTQIVPNSIYFSLTVTNKTSTFVYEYWNGSAWTALSQVVDGTSQLHRSGVLSWVVSSNWASTTVNSVTAFWIRLRVTAIGSITASPEANNIYVPSRNYIEVDDASGDIPALGELVITNANDGGDGNNWTQANTMLIGLRSIERGATFEPFLDPEVSASGTQVADLSLSASGSYVSNAVNLTTYTLAAQYLPSRKGLVHDYYGTYRIFLRYAFYDTDQVVTVKLELINFSALLSTVSEEKVLRDVTSTKGFARLLDMGQFTIGIQNFLNLNELGDDVHFNLYTKSSASSQTLKLFELILIPVDEWTGYFEDTSHSGGLTNNNSLDIDSASFFKRKLRSMVKYRGSELVTAAWRPSASGPLTVQAGKQQRFYFLSELWNGEYMASPFTQVHQVQLYTHERFLGLRGNG